MILWTIQTIEFYNRLIAENEIQVSETFIESDFKPAYDWINTQMEQRIGPKPDPNAYPIWAWHQYESSRKEKAGPKTFQDF